MCWHHFVFDTHSLKRRGGGGRGAYNEKQYAFPLPDFYHSKNLQHFVQKDFAFDVNPMLFCLLLQAVQYAIHFLTGKETAYCLESACEIHPAQRVTAARKFLRKRRNVVQASHWCVAQRWTSSYADTKLISTFSSSLEKWLLERFACYSQRQKQKDNIRLAYLAPLYF